MARPQARYIVNGSSTFIITAVPAELLPVMPFAVHARTLLTKFAETDPKTTTE